jgi:hypothetical protein
MDCSLRHLDICQDAAAPPVFRAFWQGRPQQFLPAFSAGRAGSGAPRRPGRAAEATQLQPFPGRRRLARRLQVGRRGPSLEDPAAIET